MHRLSLCVRNCRAFWTSCRITVTFQQATLLQDSDLKTFSRVLVLWVVVGVAGFLFFSEDSVWAARTHEGVERTGVEAEVSRSDARSLVFHRGRLAC